MNYQVIFSKEFKKNLKKLDKPIQDHVQSWIQKYLKNCENPRAFGKALTGNLSGYWRYRVGNYRIICEIKDNECIILAIKIGHRKEIYKK